MLNTPTHSQKPAAVFLDRDGTIIEDRGHVRDVAEVLFYPATVPALRLLQVRYRLFIVTNQSGVGKGELTLTEANLINDYVVQWLRRHGVLITAVYCCPHRRDEGCICIKPNPHFLEQAAREHGVDLRSSYTVGDHPHDVELAYNAGATGIYVLTGHGEKHREQLRSNAIVVRHIGEAADWILTHTRS